MADAGRAVRDATGAHPLTTEPRPDPEAGSERCRKFELGPRVRGLPGNPGVHELVARQVRRSPDAPAVVAPDRVLTYSELDREAEALAAELRSRGAGAGSLIGVCLERSSVMVIAVYAVLKAGAAYVPLDPTHPSSRLSQVIEGANPSLILAQTRLAQRLPAGDVPVLLADSQPRTSTAEGSAGSGRSSGSDLAYVLFTSGSTGQPKGVMVEHRSVVNHLEWRARWSKMGPGDRILQKAPLGFDISVWELFCPLICGATTVLLDPGAQRDPAAIGAAIRDRGVTMVSFTPSLLRVFVEAGEAERSASLRRVMVGGEALEGNLATEAMARFADGVQLTNLYGPTETTIISSYWDCIQGEDPVPIGKPISNTELLVLDPYLKRVSVGEQGELFIGGVGVARGYLNEPSLTEESFVPHPFTPGRRLYRTGDRARWREDGALLFEGRTDGQVKVRGNRVETAEIELALTRQLGLSHAKVLVRPDSSGDSTLVAYVVAPHEQPAPSAPEVRDRLRRLLPEYMVPSELHVVASIPLTDAGKVDTRRLTALQGRSSGDKAPSRLHLVASTPEEETRLTNLATALGGTPPAAVISAHQFEVGTELPGPDQLTALLEALRAAQPRGPYALAGYWSGGRLVHQLAQSLRAEGETVSWVGLYEAAYPERGGGPRPVLRRRGWRPSRTTRAVASAGVALPSEVCDTLLDLFASEAAFRAHGTLTLGWETVHRGVISPHQFPSDPLTPASLGGTVEVTRRRIQAVARRA